MLPLPISIWHRYLNPQKIGRYIIDILYWGTLDCMLSCREHLTKTVGKLKNRNNLLMKLAGSNWGASANTLRSSALALCYSAAEYCALVTLCSHKSDRCAVELYHVPHLWYPPFYTSPMDSSALQHWTASPTKEGCHWQAGGENRQTWQLANAAWYT